MKIGVLIPGFSAHADDWAIPVQQNLMAELAQSDQGGDVRILALRYPHHRQPYTLNGATVIPLGVGQARGLKRLRLWRDAINTLRRLHAERPFDVLHAMWADETGLIAAWAGRLFRVPVVVSILGGELTRLDDIGYGLQRGRFSRWIVGQALDGAAKIVLAKPSTRGQIAQAGYRVPDDRFAVIPLGIDPSRFYPTDEPPDPNRLIHVASLVPVKDQATLLRALARLHQTVTLDIIGDGPDRPRLAALAADLGITSRVRFLGAVSHPDLPAHYRRASLHALTSRSEAFALSVIEAAACGVPTVSTAAGIVPDDPALGLTVPIGDDAALATAIQSLLTDPTRLATLRASARQAVADRFTIAHTAAALRALYTEIVECHTTRR